MFTLFFFRYHQNSHINLLQNQWTPFFVFHKSPMGLECNKGGKMMTDEQFYKLFLKKNLSGVFVFTPSNIFYPSWLLQQDASGFLLVDGKQKPDGVCVYQFVQHTHTYSCTINCRILQTHRAHLSLYPTENKTRHGCSGLSLF